MEKVIKVKNLSFSYEENTKKVINNLSCEICAGEWVTIVGSNGSGKSTFIRLLNGLLEKNDGEIIINSLVLNDENIQKIRASIGMVFQNPDNQFVGATVENDIAFGLENKGIEYEKMHEIVDEVLAKVNMSEFKLKEPSQLSGGQKQRVAIASTIALKPNILILDEATSMLDPKGREDVIKLIKKMHKEEKMTVISISHDINEIVLSDRVFVMEEGNIAFCGTPNELFNKTNNELEKYGLMLPFTSELKEKLKSLNIKVSDKYQTEEELLSWLKLLN